MNMPADFMPRLGVTGAGSAEFAHARLRARWGMRPDETSWHRIEITRELAPVLDLARSSSLAPWVQGLAAGCDLPTIDQALRLRWREQVAEVAGWVDARWQAGVRWCALLLDLPLLLCGLRGGELPAWVARDSILGPLLLGTHADADDAAPTAALEPSLAPWLQAVRRAFDADPAQQAGQPAQRLLSHWQQAWHALLPAGGARTTIERSLVPLLSEHVRTFAMPATADGWAARRQLGGQLVALMRRHAAEPIEAFVFLALQALQLERLRAEIVGRAAFPLRTLHA